jgi:DHA1 family bicyclomycin/chloramphenicol resistance-like MFS transporter
MSTSNKTQTSPARWVIFLLAAISAITPLAIDMYLPAMLVIAQDLNTSVAMVQNSLSSYLLGFACAMLIVGPLADILGRRPLAIVGLLGFALCSLAIAYVTSIESFLLLRTCQAMSGGAAAVVIPGIVRHIYAENTAKGLSYVSMIMMLAPLLAPSIGSLLMDLSGWRSIFFTLAIYAGIVLFAAYFALPEISKRSKDAPWARMFFASYQTVFAESSVHRYIVSSTFSMFGFFTFLTAAPFVYMDVFGASERFFGLLFAANVIGLLLANFINSRLVGQVGAKRMLTYSLLVALISASALLMVSLLSLGLYSTVACVVPLMASLMLISVNSDALILMQFEHHTGTATAVLGTLKFGGGALAGPLLGLMFDGSSLPFAMVMFGAVFIILISQRVQQRKNIKAII